MKAGVQLDDMIAEKVFGLTVETRVEGYGNGRWLWRFYSITGVGMRVPDFSENLEDAFKVVNAMVDKGYKCQIRMEASCLKPQVCFSDRSRDRNTWIDGETLPEAICLAALHTLTSGDKLR